MAFFVRVFSGALRSFCKPLGRAAFCISLQCLEFQLLNVCDVLPVTLPLKF